jgi:hypothetical protein
VNTYCVEVAKDLSLQILRTMLNEKVVDNITEGRSMNFSNYIELNNM